MQVRFWSRRRNIIVTNIFLLCLLLPFQNCSNQLQSNSQLSNSNTSSNSSAATDSVAPTINFTSTPALMSTQTTANFEFTYSDISSGIASVQCSINNSPLTNCTSPISLTNLIVAAHQFSVVVTDTVGNSNRINYYWSVQSTTTPPPADAQPPTLSFITTPPTTTQLTTAQFQFSAADAGSGLVSVKCALDSAALTNCVSPINLSNLTATGHIYSVEATDFAGNKNKITYTWIIAAPTPLPPPINANMKSIFMSSGHGGRTLMSCDDGLSWINDRSDAGADAGDHSASAGRGLDAGGGYFYANFGWGYDGSLRRSQDGINWTVIHNGSWGGGVAYGKDSLFHGTEGGNWYTSINNGTSWVKLVVPNFDVYQSFDHPSVSRLNNKIFVSGRNQKVGISYDQGKTWTLLTSGFLGDTEQRSFAEGNGLIVSLSFNYGTNTGNVSRSLDQGKTWTGFNLGGNWSSIVFNGSQFMAWSNGKVWRSTDGLNWTSTAIKIDGQIASSFEAATRYNPTTGTYVAILNGWQKENANQKAYRSKDGENWTTLANTKFTGGNHIESIIVGEIESKYCP